MYINSLNNFRALAIVVIVAGHCLSVVDITFDSPAEHVFRNLISGGTSLFVFISGFLFYHVFYHSFEYRPFLRKKLRNLLLPYLVMGIFPVTYLVVTQQTVPSGGFLPEGDGFVQQYLVPAAKYYATGRFFGAYWYIPFILIMFALSPLHVLFIRSRFAIQASIVVALSCAAILVHRPVANGNLIQSLVYFTPIYLTGTLCSIHRDRLYRFLAGKEVILLGLVLAAAVLQAALGAAGGYHKPAFSYGGFDLQFPQKLLMALFFLATFHRFEQFKAAALNVLASTSFAIYFLHPYLIWGLRALADQRGQFLFVGWWGYSLVATLMLGLCAVVALAIKRLFGRRSRYIIGY